LWYPIGAGVKAKMPDWLNGIIEGGKDSDLDDSTP
jgi:hypothetical protein